MLLADAEQALNAALAKAIEIGISMATAVDNKSGILTVFKRMDNNDLAAIPLAGDKAYTGLVYRLGTLGLGRQCLNGGPLFGLQVNRSSGRAIFRAAYPSGTMGHSLARTEPAAL